MARSKSSQQWMQEHFQDEYVKKAQALGYRSRAVFKLIEIQEKDKIIKPGINIVDLGAAPGGWSEYASKIVGKKSKVIALDLLPIEPIEGVEFIQGDFREDEVLEELYKVLDGEPVHLLLSDMAPNMSGSREMDQPRSIYLGELALDAAQRILVKGGTFLIKMFQGAGFDEYYNQVRQQFNSVAIRKPKASRARSNEVYILAKGFK
ncbi:MULTISPECIES: 23S rRNA (uridine(2552)-2'-O)-methyltransferase RlmE [Methylomonas]|uniref:Ribosomal RNA large subunit methyltransferase E n=1 Tax=Methylomonas koyamae TaxID=702114 RepID=A0A177NRW5_9GAMM|nr:MULTISPECIES: 23S rRNA (uridine(2552)-2'-O)-methyltransferase RlmE [Methylomonas]ANE54623.1 23S rRNA methyltransferase [Methylomonas sp. DH-1]ATG89285.1 23S rRNA methyltransferase [Methylomonas koyamae]OAI20786.1 23S rRNA methyltransferase [Methylomonas koyamae]OAI27043.1 23S rRNA methyltransferase [Methylomonas koyamae]BBL57343.1 ribosomal RNA large subunit methyltransferase E [Methylomonas koyamae]